METYILQVVCFQAIFLIVYFLVLRQETFFQYNRLYLLSSVLLSLAIPFIQIPFLQSSIPISNFEALLPEVTIGAVDPVPVEINKASPQETITKINWLYIYGLGVLLSLGVLIVKLSKLFSYLRYKKGTSNIIELPNSQEAFTFFNYIFIGNELDTLSRKQILNHEYVHIKQRHTWDLAFFEVLRLIMWFNPLIYIYQKQVSLLHEYIADKNAVRLTSKKTYYQELLNVTFGTQSLSFTNTFFNQSLIKKRIVMLQKSSSKRSALLKYALIVPVVFVMLVQVACSDDNYSEERNTSIDYQVAELKAILENKENLSEDEFQSISEIVSLSVEKRYSNGSAEINSTFEGIEIVEQERVAESNVNVPFAVIEKAPIYPGCADLSTNEERKSCMSKKITQHIGDNFDTSIAKKSGLLGINRIFASFKIDKNGNIVNLRTRSPHPDLDIETARVLSLLPKMQPGEQKGEPVGVLYSLPITFKISE